VSDPSSKDSCHLSIKFVISKGNSELLKAKEIDEEEGEERERK
jgi:hypothetical protein